MQRPTVELYFDTISPYSFFAFEVLVRYSSVWDIDLKLVPVFLGGVMAGSGNQPPALVPVKAKYMKEDLQRCADYFHVPRIPELPSNFFAIARDLRMQRCLCALDCLGYPPDLHRAVARQFFLYIHSYTSSRDRNNNIALTEKSLLSTLVAAGMEHTDAERILAHSTHAEAKETLKHNTEIALERGAFGSPTIIVNGKLFFGSDRFDLIAHELRQKWMGPTPIKHCSAL